MRRIGKVCLGVALLALVGAGCGGGGGGDAGGANAVDNPGSGGNPGGNIGGTGGGTAPAFAGFELPLQKGTYWEFSYEHTSSSFAQGSGGSGGTSTGTFRVALGEAIDIGAQTLYRVHLVSLSGNPPTIPMRWTYVGIDGDKLVGSTDGATVSVIFDAQEGAQAGGGFFGDYGSSLVVASEGTVQNIDGLSGQAVLLAQSYEQSNCQYFSGVGTICGGEMDVNDRKQEYYKADIGPYGYYSYFSYSDSGGGFYTSSSSEWKIGLTDYSFSGDGYYLPPTVSALQSGDVAVYYGLYGGGTALVDTDPYNAADPEGGASVVMRHVLGTTGASAVTPAVPAGSATSYALRTDGGQLLQFRRYLKTDGAVGSQSYRAYVRAYDPMTHTALDADETATDDQGLYWEWLSLSAFTEFGGKYRFFTLNFGNQVWEQPVGSTVAAEGLPFTWRQFFSVGDQLYAGHYLHDFQSDTGPTDVYSLLRLDPTDNDVAETVTAFGFQVADPTQSMRDFAVDQDTFYFAMADFATGEVAVWRAPLAAGTAEKIWTATVTGARPRAMIDADGGYLVITVVTENPLASQVYLYDPGTGQVDPLDLPGNGVKLNVEIAAIP